MNTRSISRCLKGALITTGVTSACTLIGTVEGAISGAIGAAIRTAAGSEGHDVEAIALAGSGGVGALAIAEGIVIGALAINGVFGTAADMERRGYQKIEQRILGYLGYTANQVLGGVTAGLMLRMAGYASPLFTDIVADVAIGSAIAGLVITPLVTAATVYLIDVAYRAMQEQDDEENALVSNQALSFSRGP